ncbi:MAG: lamin tail domain-containing protein, partial [Deltaproteobacteria bacterium]|nr:lamin tail domain-containing protein [Deltaproteobacteria bacterium]
SPPEDCEVVGDEDNNGVSDCDDATCFGFAGVCDAAELNCGDGGDNDGDGLTDCEDVIDCGADAACLPAQGVFESFATDEFDLNGMDVLFTPNAGAVDGFDFSVEPNTGFVDAAGSGTITGTLALGDDGAVQYTFYPGFEFPFYGQNYTSMFVGSNGSITFGIGDTYASSTSNGFFSRPRIAGFDKDLDPSRGGTVTVDEYADRIVVTFEDVPDYDPTTNLLQTFQMVLFADGSVVLAYDTIALSGTAFVGVSDGDFGGTSLFPDEVSFFVVSPIINEVAYDDAGTDDFEFIELKGTPGDVLNGFTLAHIDGANEAPIWNIDLAGMTVPASGYLVIGSTNVVNIDVDFATAGISSIQNGPDSLVVFAGFGTAGQVAVDAMSYEFGPMEPNNLGEGTSAIALDGNWNTSLGR